MAKLSQQRKKFAQKYRELGNATQAAIQAGYSERTARSQGQRLLTNVDIQKYLADLNKKSEKRNIATVDDILEELTKIAMGQTEEEVVYLAQETGNIVGTKKRPDDATRIRAMSEILKRYPSEVDRMDQTINVNLGKIKDG